MKNINTKELENVLDLFKYVDLNKKITDITSDTCKLKAILDLANQQLKGIYPEFKCAVEVYLKHFIIAYELLRKDGGSIVNLHGIDLKRVHELLSELYILSKGRYDPEPEHRVLILLSELREFHPSLNLFKDEYLRMPIRSILYHDELSASHAMMATFNAFRYDVRFNISYKQNGGSILNMYVDYGREKLNLDSVRLSDFIVAYEVLIRTGTKSITNIRSIGKKKASHAMNALYLLSDGKYGPEPDIRLALQNDSVMKSIEKDILNAKKGGIKYEELTKLIDKIYK